MKTGAYQGYSDKGYKRYATNNGDRLINGLVLSKNKAPIAESVKTTKIKAK